jgi:hypothetical protein
VPASSNRAKAKKPQHSNLVAHLVGCEGPRRLNQERAEEHLKQRIAALRLLASHTHQHVGQRAATGCAWQSC